MYFHLSQAWLRVDQLQFDKATQIWDELSLTVREVTADFATRDELREVVLESKVAWERGFRAESHCAEVDGQYDRLEIEMRLGRSYRDLIDETCEPLLFAVKEAIRQIREAIERRLINKLAMILRLAELVDQGIHSRDIYREMFPTSQPIPASQPSTSCRADLNARMPGMDQPSPQLHRPERCLDASATLPQVTWFRAIRQQWAQLQWPVELLPSQIILGELSPAISLEAVVNGIRDAAKSHLALSTDDANPEISVTPILTQLTADSSQSDKEWRAGSPSPAPIIRENAGRSGNVGPAPALSARVADPLDLARLREIKKAIDSDDKYIGQSLPILRMFEAIRTFNQRPDSPILLLGPTGVGKTEVAELIHRDSGRKGDFAREQATSAMSADQGIIRARWVGYAKGSNLPNAKRDGSEGLLQQYRNGTIFFDELHGTEPWFQRFLLQVLDGKEISQAHGDPAWVKPEVRMIFASNRSLPELNNEIEHDLLARLRPWIIYVPPLVDRKEDIILFVEKWCEGYRADKRFLLALLRYVWPGNVRELQDGLEIATATTGKPAGKREHRVGLSLEHLRLADMSVIDEVRQMPETEAEREVMQLLVWTFAEQGLRKGRGLQKRLAAFLGVSQGKVSKRLASLGINCTKCD